MSTGRELLVCVNHRLSAASPSCGARGGVALADALEALVAEQGLDLAVVRIHCFGRCARGPNVRLAGGPFVEGAAAAEAPGVLARLLGYQA